MQKAKKYDFKDSNMALFGSDTDKKVKKESAETEPAWKGAGAKVGLQIWRIVKFKVEHWPKDDYGKFYDGDSYIILNTYKEEDSEALNYDVHFWIGQYSSQDEYGTAAYKTVELDTLLDDKPIQHREVMGYESAMFKSYFKSIELLKGGADTGFRHVKEEEYTPRLFQFHYEKRQKTCKEVPRYKTSIDETDVFLFDEGLKLYLWQGAKCNKNEKFQGLEHLQKLKNERYGKAAAVTVDCTDPEYRKLVDGLPDSCDDDDDDRSPSPDVNFTSAMFRLSDESGKMEFTKEAEGSIPESKLDSNDVFICDIKTELYVWIGKNATQEERDNAMSRAHEYLKTTCHPLAAITCLKEGEPCRAASFFATILDRSK